MYLMQRLQSRQIVGWGIFILFGLLTWIVHSYAWMFEFWYPLLFALGLLHVAVGVWVLVMYRFGLRSTLVVLAGLLVGQWWFVTMAFAVGIWSIRGFAP
jgi:hypothetical protein